MGGTRIPLSRCRMDGMRISLHSPVKVFHKDKEILQIDLEFIPKLVELYTLKCQLLCQLSVLFPNYS